VRENDFSHNRPFHYHEERQEKPKERELEHVGGEWSPSQHARKS